MPTIVKRKKRLKFDPKVAPAPWSASALYRRSQANRRLLLLELIAWATYKAETIKTKEEFEAFEAELRDVRSKQWGDRPWSGATKPEAYERHVLDLARAFTSKPAYWPYRKVPPLT